jgi:hypothetical protein
MLKTCAMSYGKTCKRCLVPDSETLAVTRTTDSSTHFDTYWGYAIGQRVAGSSSSQY